VYSRSKGVPIDIEIKVCLSFVRRHDYTRSGLSLRLPAKAGDSPWHQTTYGVWVGGIPTGNPADPA
jgi:hypothetical protein